MRSKYISQNKVAQLCDYPVASMPGLIATITFKGCTHALHFHGPKSELGVRYIPDTSSLHYDNGKTYAVQDSGALEVLDSYSIDDFAGWDGFEKVDATVMHMLFTILLNCDRKRLESDGDITPVVAVYIPDLLKTCGVTNVGAERRTALMDKCRVLQHVYGVFPETEMVLPFLQNCDALEDQGILILDSPYLNYLIRHLNFCRAKEARHWHKAYVPIVETHLKATIYKERNVNAAEIVRFICTEVTRFGYSKGHLKASTIVENTNVMYYQVENTKSIKYKTRYYTRAFKKAWELIATQTTLFEKYPKLKIPSLDDVDSVPTFLERDRVFEIHRGTVRKKQPEAKKVQAEPMSNVIQLSKTGTNEVPIAAETNTHQPVAPGTFEPTRPESPLLTFEDYMAMYEQENSRRKEQGLPSLEEVAAQRMEYHSEEAIAAMCEDDPTFDPSDLQPTVFSAIIVDSDDPRYYDFPFESSSWRM